MHAKPPATLEDFDVQRTVGLELHPYPKKVVTPGEGSKVLAILQRTGRIDEATTRSGRLEGVISLSDIAELDEQSGAATLRDVSARERRGDSGRQSGWKLPL